MKNGATIAQFVYDGDGARVMAVENGQTTIFVGAHYEKTGTVITKYYFAGSTRVAMRKYTIPQNMTVEYLLSDHLGSTSMTADVNGAKVSEIRYKACGEVRYAWTDAPANTSPVYALTRYTFTGQYAYLDDPTTSASEGFGLMFYNARWLDPVTGRFAQADSIIPESQGTQAWDRYAFVNNNPVRYNDPTGHEAGDMCDRGYENCPGTVYHLHPPNPYAPPVKLGNDGYYSGCNGVAEPCTAYTYYYLNSSSAIDLGQMFINHFSVTDKIIDAATVFAPEVKAPVEIPKLAGFLLPKVATLFGDAVADILPEVFPTIGNELVDAGQAGGSVTITLATNLKTPVHAMGANQVTGIFPSTRFGIFVTSNGRTQPIYIQGIYLPEVKYVLEHR